MVVILSSGLANSYTDQHTCPAAFRWLQGLKMNDKLFILSKAAVSNRYCWDQSC